MLWILNPIHLFEFRLDLDYILKNPIHDHPYGLGPTRFDVGTNWLYSTSGQTDFTRHRLGSAWTNLDQCRPGQTRLYIVWTDLTRHRPILTLLDIGLERLGLTLSRTHSVWHQFGLTRRDIDSDRLDSTSAWTDLARHRPESNRLNIGYKAQNGMVLTLVYMGSGRLGSRLTWLDMGSGQLGSTWHRAELDFGALSSTWARVDSTQLCPGSTRLDFFCTDSARLLPKMTCARLLPKMTLADFARPGFFSTLNIFICSHFLQFIFFCFS